MIFRGGLFYILAFAFTSSLAASENVLFYSRRLQSKTYSKNHYLRTTEPYDNKTEFSSGIHGGRQLSPIFDWLDQVTGRAAGAASSMFTRTNQWSNAAAQQAIGASNNMALQGHQMASRGVNTASHVATDAGRAGAAGLQRAGQYTTQLGRVITEPIAPLGRAIGEGARASWAAATEGLARTWDASLGATQNFGRSTSNFMSQVFGYAPFRPLASSTLF